MYEILFIVGYINSKAVGHIKIGELSADDIVDAYERAKEIAELNYETAIIPSIDGGFTIITEDDVVLEDDQLKEKLKELNEVTELY